MAESEPKSADVDSIEREMGHFKRAIEAAAEYAERMQQHCAKRVLLWEHHNSPLPATLKEYCIAPDKQILCVLELVDPSDDVWEVRFQPGCGGLVPPAKDGHRRFMGTDAAKGYAETCLRSWNSSEDYLYRTMSLMPL